MKSLHLLKLRSHLLVALIALSLRQVAGLAGLVGEVTDWQQVAGSAIAVIGFILYRYEIRKGYTYQNKGPVGLGGVMVNGASVVGLSLLFFGVSFLKGMFVIAIFAVVLLSLHALIREKREK